MKFVQHQKPETTFKSRVLQKPFPDCALLTKLDTLCLTHIKK